MQTKTILKYQRPKLWWAIWKREAERRNTFIWLHIKLNRQMEWVRIDRGISMWNLALLWISGYLFSGFRSQKGRIKILLSIVYVYFVVCVCMCVSMLFTNQPTACPPSNAIPIRKIAFSCETYEKCHFDYRNRFYCWAFGWFYFYVAFQMEIWKWSNYIILLILTDEKHY